MFGKVHGEKEICFLVKGIILMDLKIVPLILVSTKPSQDFSMSASWVVLTWLTVRWVLEGLRTMTLVGFIWCLQQGIRFWSWQQAASDPHTHQYALIAHLVCRFSKTLGRKIKLVQKWSKTMSSSPSSTFVCKLSSKLNFAFCCFCHTFYCLQFEIHWSVPWHLFRFADYVQ